MPANPFAAQMPHPSWASGVVWRPFLPAAYHSPSLHSPIHPHRRERGRLRRQDRFYRRAICDLALPCAVPIVAHSTLESLAWLVARSVREDEIWNAPPALRDGMTDACAFQHLAEQV